MRYNIQRNIYRAFIQIVHLLKVSFIQKWEEEKKLHIIKNCTYKSFERWTGS